MQIVAYLEESEYALFGVPDATFQMAASASRLINGRLGRPEGLTWSHDAGGNPAWMANKTPTRSYKLSSGASAGANTLTLSGMFGQGDIGSAVVIDRCDTASAETCIVAAASGDTLTLTTQFDHAAGATLEYGLTLSEDARVSRHGSFRLSAAPLAAILGITGSYARHRHGSGFIDWIDEVLDTGGTLWNPFPLGQCDIDPTGECRLLPGPVRAGFSRVRVSYVAGWASHSLPYAIKQATANLMRTMIDSEIPANIKMMKAGDATIVNFNSSVFDSDTENLLRPYRTLRI